MNKQYPIWQLMAESLQQGIAVMLLYVLQSNGSSPGRQGFFMAVNAKGQMEGSIGGGIMEHKFVEMARQQLAVDSTKLTEASVRKQVHDKAAGKNQSGMICSGEQTIVLYPLKRADIPTVENIIACLENNKNGLLQLSPTGLQFTETVPSVDFYFEMQQEDNWLYQEKIGYKNRLYIIGGGHCSLAFAELMGRMDFYISLYDDRENLNTFLQNGFAHEKHIVTDYTELKNKIPPGSNHYVVLMTFGYRTDSIALKALLGKQFKYLGMLGSKKKIEKLFADYKSEGLDERLLRNIFSPIGLHIKSQTPEEIAISIAAEIIKVKNQYLP